MDYCRFTSDDSLLPDLVKAPSPPAGPVPIPYPNIGTSSDKPDSKPKGNEKRGERDFDGQGMPRINGRLNYSKTKRD